MAIIEGPTDSPIRRPRLVAVREEPNANHELPQSSESASNNDRTNSTVLGSTPQNMDAAFRAANDEDAATILLIMDNPSASSSPSYSFYMIPREWMDSFLYFTDSLPDVGASENDMRPGEIQNAVLLVQSENKMHDFHSSYSQEEEEKEASVSGCRMAKQVDRDKDDDIPNDADDEVDTDEEEGRRHLRRKKWFEKQNNRHHELDGSKQVHRLRPNLVHGDDYILVGENVWLLLSRKFGYDVTLPCRCVVMPEKADNMSERSMSKIAVEIPTSLPSRFDKVRSSSDRIFVPIPMSGKFEYNKRSASDARNEMQKDESDVVSEDEDASLNDLFPSISDSGTNGANATAGESPVLLLPPSTTMSAERQLALASLDNEVKHGRAIDPATDLEFESDENGGDYDGYPRKKKVATSGRVANKRKRYASGLGNLGNTCFMNSSLQCLAHTSPLREYFLNGDYENDLNRNNPLGTGGDLATEFADLLAQMWGTSSNQSYGSMYSNSRHGNGYYSSSNYGLSSSVVYPRNFKYALGRHAEQFMGYDQHDSQELATYLLDALHEDTNRVTKKPYIEKPEQGEDESDSVAADKAWDLHIRRENSRVLEIFMGQVKSRVQCPREGCERVSTTFDPFMYLSVPIPGATDRTLTITYVPLNPKERMKKLIITLKRTSLISALQAKIKLLIEELETLNDSTKDKKLEEDKLNAEDICVVDIWSNEVYSFFSPNDELDKIRDNDVTYAYQLRSVASIHKEENMQDADSHDESYVMSSKQGKGERGVGFGLDPETIKKLDQENEWMNVLERHVQQPTMLYTLLNPKRSNHQDRINFFEKMDKFIRICQKCADCSNGVSNSKVTGSSPEDRDEGMRETEDEYLAQKSIKEDGVDKGDRSSLNLEERSEMSTTFRNIRTAHDLALLEFCSRKFLEYSVSLEKEKKKKFKDGLVVQVVFKRQTPSSLMPKTFHHHASVGTERTFASPVVQKVSSSLTVYGLRELLAVRLSRVLKTDQKKRRTMEASFMSYNAAGTNHSPSKCTNESTVTNGQDADVDHSSNADDMLENISDVSDTPVMDTYGNCSQEVFVMRQIPMVYARKTTSYYSSRQHSNRKLGSLPVSGNDDNTAGRRISLASPNDEAEQQLLSEVVGNLGTVYLHWPSELLDVLDEDEWEMVEEIENDPREQDKKKGPKITSVLDCIAKYCQMEQLEESEMWYCNRCKEHVRAWKQFHLYCTPPILIIHLKRFQYSSVTHRRDKIDTFVDFPLDGLDLTDEVMYWIEDKKPIYDCYAVSNHYGGLGGGHYTAYARSDDGLWCHFDDSRVTTGVGEKEVKSAAAYVLYYRRRDVVIRDAQSLSYGIESGSNQEDDSDYRSNRVPSELSLSKTDDMEVDDTDFACENSSQTCSSPLNSVEEDMYADNDEGSGGDIDSVTGNDGHHLVLQ